MVEATTRKALTEKEGKKKKKSNGPCRSVDRYKTEEGEYLKSENERLNSLSLSQLDYSSCRIWQPRLKSNSAGLSVTLSKVERSAEKSSSRPILN